MSASESNGDLFAGLQLHKGVTLLTGETWGEFVREYAALTKGIEYDPMPLVNLGMNLGIHIGVASCRVLYEDESQYEVRTKDEWERHYGRQWRTIRKHVRYREPQENKFAKIAAIHKDDIDVKL